MKNIIDFEPHKLKSHADRIKNRFNLPKYSVDQFMDDLLCCDPKDFSTCRPLVDLIDEFDQFKQKNKK